MRQNPHVRICGGPGSATTLVYPTGGRCQQHRTTLGPNQVADSKNGSELVAEEATKKVP